MYNNNNANHLNSQGAGGADFGPVGGLDIARISGQTSAKYRGGSKNTRQAALEELGRAAANPVKQKGVILFSSGGHSFRKYPGRALKGGGKRGSVARFSEDSRKRMREKMVKFDWGKIAGARRALWVTFTAKEGSAADFKTWLSNWRRWLEREWPGVWFLWRIEYQERGVAHVHLIVVFPSQMASLLARGVIVKRWLAVVGEDNASGCAQHIKPVKGVAGIASYISDASKVSQATPPEGEKPGRWWGIRGAARAVADLSEYVIVYGVAAFVGFRRFVRGLRTGRKRSMKRKYTKTKPVKDKVEFFEASMLVNYLGT